MTDLTFVPMDEPGLREFESWFDDAELRHRYDRPTQLWLDFVGNTPGVCAWMVYEGDSPIGQLQLDVEGQIGYIGLTVKPELRNHGYGHRVLQAFLARADIATLDRIEAGAAQDNQASQHCLRAAGFVQRSTGPDAEGFLRFVYYVKPNRGEN
jgi:RimJ/RimL family protein N-acetyltransferase